MKRIKVAVTTLYEFDEQEFDTTDDEEIKAAIQRLIESGNEFEKDSKCETMFAFHISNDPI